MPTLNLGQRRRLVIGARVESVPPPIDELQQADTENANGRLEQEERRKFVCDRETAVALFVEFWDLWLMLLGLIAIILLHLPEKLRHLHLFDTSHRGF